MNKKISIGNSKLITGIVCLIFCINAFFTVLSTVNENAIFFLFIADMGLKIVKYLILAVGILVIGTNFNKYNIFQLFVFVMLMLFFLLYQTLLGSYINYILILFVVFFIRDDSKLIYKASILGIFLGLFLVIVSINLGIIENQIGGFRSDGNIRYNMGFYGLMIFGRFWRIIAMYHTLSTDRIKIHHMLFVMLGATFAYLETQTRSEFLLVFIIYFAHFFIKKNSIKFTKIIYILGVVLLLCLPIGSALIGKYYFSSNFFGELNQFTTGRIKYSASLWNNLDVKFLGNHDFQFYNGLEKGDIGYFYNFVDNGWDQMILIQGFGPLIILMFFIFLLLRKLKNEKETYALFLLVVMIILFTVSQSVMFNLVINPLILKFGMFFKQKQIQHHKNIVPHYSLDRMEGNKRI